MDKEKILKKFKIKFIIGDIFSSSLLFVWIYSQVNNLITQKQFYAMGFGLIIICLILGFIDSKVMGEKNKQEELAIMPLIISIHDTVAGLKKQKTVYCILYLLAFGFGFGLRYSSVVFIIIGSVSFLFLQFANLTDKKIKYLENKPEGMNF